MKRIRGSPDRQAGFALLAVTIFVLIVALTGAGLFAIAGHETHNAMYRQSSAEAFYLAQGGIERAQAVFLADRTWRAGWTGQAAGRGTYDVSVRDTVFERSEDALSLVSTGHVAGAARRIEVMAEALPTYLGLGMLILGDAYIGGSLCLRGVAHIGGRAGGNHLWQDPNFDHRCAGEYTDHFILRPPPASTQPDRYRGTTYYYVRGNRIGGRDQARIYNRVGADITTLRGDSLTDVTRYFPLSHQYQFSIVGIRPSDGVSRVQHYFDESTGIFRRELGDSAVVVNFGEIPLVDSVAVARLTLDGGLVGSTITSTVINTRFTGLSDEQRLDWRNWIGGTTELRQITMAPRLGLALLAYDVDRPGAGPTDIGTEQWPALLYVTRDVNSLNSNVRIVGSVVTLRDWHNNGTVEVAWSDGYRRHLPGYMEQDSTAGVAGSMKILRWREVAAPGD